jgi:hypothetical protein
MLQHGIVESEAAMFDHAFFHHVLARQMEAIAATYPQQTPVLQLHLGDGALLDVCRIVGLSNTWLAVAHYREAATCDDVDLAFVPYPLIVRISIALPHVSTRPIGFSTTSGDHLTVRGGVPELAMQPS